jgi:flagellar protein FliL
MAEEETPPVEEAPPEKGGMMKTLIIAAVALLAGGGGGMFLVGPLLAPRFVEAGTTEGVVEGEEGEEGAVAEPPSDLFTLRDFIVNPAGTDGTRFLMMSLAIEVVDPKRIKDLEARDAEIRDALILVVGSKTVRELADVTQREALVVAIKSSLDAVLGAGVIRRIFIPQFVIQ